MNTSSQTPREQHLAEAVDVARGEYLTDATGTKEFFQPGRTYIRDLPYRAPELRRRFRCIAVAEHPKDGSPRAFGFEQRGDGAPWSSSALREQEWAQGWIEVADGSEGGAR